MRGSLVVFVDRTEVERTPIQGTGQGVGRCQAAQLVILLLDLRARLLEFRQRLRQVCLL